MELWIQTCWKFEKLKFEEFETLKLWNSVILNFLIEYFIMAIKHYPRIPIPTTASTTTLGDTVFRSCFIICHNTAQMNLGLFLCVGMHCRTLSDPAISQHKPYKHYPDDTSRLNSMCFCLASVNPTRVDNAPKLISQKYVLGKTRNRLQQTCLLSTPSASHWI